MLEVDCFSKKWSFSVIKNLSSGVNYNKPGLKQLLEQTMKGQVACIFGFFLFLYRL